MPLGTNATKEPPVIHTGIGLLTAAAGAVAIATAAAVTAQGIFVRDRKAGLTRRVSGGRGGVQSNNPSSGPATSADGRFIAFLSFATNLVPRDTNDATDAFVRDRRPAAAAPAATQ